MQKLIIVLISALLLGCNNSYDKPVDRRSVKFIETIKPTTLFPPLINNASESHIVSQIHDALLRVNTTTLEVEGELCKRWVLNTNQDQYIFHIRDDVYFHEDTCFKSKNERKLTAFDVKKSFENLIHFRSKNKLPLGLLVQVNGVDEYIAGKSSEIEGIYVRDSFSVEFKLTKPNPAFHYALVNPYMAILPSKGLDVYGKDCNIGCGPFQLSYATNNLDSVVLEKNKDYFKTDTAGNKLPFIERVVVIVEKVPQKSLRLLQNGDIDFILSMHEEHVKTFIEQNIELFQGEKPPLILEQAEGLEKSKIYLLRNSKLNGIQFNQANQLYLDMVYVKDSNKTNRTKD